MSDLTICQVCNKNPAVYGDGLTWSRCSSCQLKKIQEKEIVEPEIQPPVQMDEGTEHKIIEGLISIIIPVHMSTRALFHYTGNCIGSVRQYYENSYELVIVDNASPIQPPNLQSYYADKVIQNEENLGYTKAVNQGIRMSSGEYIVLIQNDVQVFSGWLAGFINLLAHNEVDLVMAHPMYSATEPFARASEAAEYHQGARKLDQLEKDFSCVAFKRSLIEEIGLFDERFFMYFQGEDFLKRMREAGKTYKMVDRIAVSHILNATGETISNTPEIIEKDKKAFDEKWNSTPEVVDPIKKESGPTNLVRTEDTGDAIYFIKYGVYHHVANPETLYALGFTFGDEKTITKKELDSMAKYGKEITMKNVTDYA